MKNTCKLTNKERKYKSFSIYQQLKINKKFNDLNDEDIIIFLDSDDWLINILGLRYSGVLK